MSYGGGSPGGRKNITVAEWQEISISPELMERIDRMERNLDVVMERLTVLDKPNPEKLAKFKQLKVVYEKYKFLEKLCGEDDDGCR